MLIVQRPQIEEEVVSDHRSRFIVEPLEPGFGYTLGNTLRRTLLSRIPGAAITSLRIEGVQHEFSTIEGVTEDVADIILNLKGVRFRANEGADGNIHFIVKGPGAWTAKNIADATSDYEILNPEHHVANVSAGASFAVELRMERGRGYVPGDENKRADDPIGVVAVDAIFTPIKNVRYTINQTRVGEKIDFEALTMEVTTDGSILPEDSLASAAQILRDHVNLFIKMDSEPQPTEEEKEVDAEVQRVRELLSQSVDELDLSVRAHNCLKAANIKTIGDLVRREESEMLKFRNFGRKSLQELMQVIEDRNLVFGMDVDRFLDDVKS